MPPSRRIQIEPSEIFVNVNGVECRVWNGITEDDNQVYICVAAVISRTQLEGLVETVVEITDGPV
jgi:hypothetical protein